MYSVRCTQYVAVLKPSRFIDGANSRKSLENRKKERERGEKMNIFSRTTATTPKIQQSQCGNKFGVVNGPLHISRKVTRRQVRRVCHVVCVCVVRAFETNSSKYTKNINFLRRYFLQGSVHLAWRTLTHNLIPFSTKFGKQGLSPILDPRLPDVSKNWQMNQTENSLWICMSTYRYSGFQQNTVFCSFGKTVLMVWTVW